MLKKSSAPIILLLIMAVVSPMGCIRMAAEPLNLVKTSDRPCTISWTYDPYTSQVSEREWNDYGQFIIYISRTDPNSEDVNWVKKVTLNGGYRSYTFEFNECNDLLDGSECVWVSVEAYYLDPDATNDSASESVWSDPLLLHCREAQQILCPTDLNSIEEDPCIIQWRDCSENEEGFKIFIMRSSDPSCRSGGTWTEHGEIERDNDEGDVETYNFGISCCELLDDLPGTGDYLCVKVGAYVGENIGYSAPHTLIEDTATCSPPNPPSYVEKSHITCAVSWGDDSNNEEGFNIYVKKSSGDDCPSSLEEGWILEGSVEQGIRSYEFGQSCEDFLSARGMELEFGEKLCVRVASYNDYGEASSDPIVLYEKVRPFVDVSRAGYQERLVSNTLGSILDRIQDPYHVLYGVQGSDSSEPETINLDVTDPQGRSFRAESSTYSEPLPRGAVQGTTVNVNAYAFAEVGFSFQLVPLVGNAPEDAEVPVIVHAQGQTSTGQTGGVRTVAEFKLTASIQNITTVNSCPPSSPNSCYYPLSSFDEYYRFPMDLTLNTHGAVYMKASFFSDNSGSGSADVTVSSVQIDPEARINGELATNLYDLVFSEGVFGS